MHKINILPILLLVCFLSKAIHSEPIVLNGEMVPELLGKPLSSIKVLDLQGRAIPFQIDEVTKDGEYVLDAGEHPNEKLSNGLLDPQDEIAFLFEDCADFSGSESDSGKVIISRGGRRKAVIIRSDQNIALNSASYMEYDHLKQILKTPFYYAAFGKDRFHFTKAGVKDFQKNAFIHLTNELRIEILLKALWGMVPIRYSEENVVCTVRRYKCGPIRLIRRGDFHLSLGLGVKGSKAAVNQICYPQLVKVPVFVHVPFRFRTLFSEAYIEMTPVITDAGSDCVFSVPSDRLEFPLRAENSDTLCLSVPENKLFTVHNSQSGYGWILQTSMDHTLLEGSGFIFRKPSSRKGYAECGYRLTVRDIPKGYYQIVNWVLFSDGSYSGLLEDSRSLQKPALIESDKKSYSNRLGVFRSRRSGN